MADDKVEIMDDAEVHAETRDALTFILDSLAPLLREDKIKVMSCARIFFDLPRSE